MIIFYSMSVLCSVLIFLMIFLILFANVLLSFQPNIIHHEVHYNSVSFHIQTDTDYLPSCTSIITILILSFTNLIIITELKDIIALNKSAHITSLIYGVFKVPSGTQNHNTVTFLVSLFLDFIMNS